MNRGALLEALANHCAAHALRCSYCDGQRPFLVVLSVEDYFEGRVQVQMCEGCLSAFREALREK